MRILEVKSFMFLKRFLDYLVIILWEPPLGHIQVNVIENFNSLQAALDARIKKKQTFFNSSANQVRNEIRDWLDQYSNSNTENDVIQFWRHKSLSLKPIDRDIAKLAQFYLTPPPTSVDVERLFSTAGDILTNERSTLNPENAEKILFCRENFKHVDFQY